MSTSPAESTTRLKGGSARDDYSGCDDEPDYSLIVRSVLMTEGWKVVLAEHGEDALTKLAEGAVDLVIADIYMPIMAGIKLHRKVRSMAQYENIPFLFVSAFDDQHTLSAVQNPRVDGFLKKGRPMEELLEWIRHEGSVDTAPLIKDIETLYIK